LRNQLFYQSVQFKLSKSSGAALRKHFRFRNALRQTKTYNVA